MSRPAFGRMIGYRGAEMRGKPYVVGFYGLQRIGTFTAAPRVGSLVTIVACRDGGAEGGGLEVPDKFVV